MKILKRYWIILISVFLIGIFCGFLDIDEIQQTEINDWVKKHNVAISLDTSLCHYGRNFITDSVVGIDYIGFNGEDTFYPINKNGIIANTIKKKKRLNSNQVLRLHKMLSNSKFYVNPRIVACYEPQLAFVYFRKGKVIAQTQVCLSCAGLRSTAKIMPKKFGGLFNQIATIEFRKFAKELGLD